MVHRRGKGNKKKGCLKMPFCNTICCHWGAAINHGFYMRGKGNKKKGCFNEALLYLMGSRYDGILRVITNKH